MADSSAYKKGLKGISVFGGLQIYKILISVISTKISAVFLGPVGLGIYGLYTSTMTTIEGLTNCGLGISAVKDIAQSKGNDIETARTFIVLNRLVWFTGLIGVAVCFFFADILSEVTFGNHDYAWGFRIISLTLLAQQLTAGKEALVIGLSKYKMIAKLRLYVGLLTLIASATFYIIMGIRGIVPVIFASAFIHAIVAFAVTRKIELPKVKVTRAETFTLGKLMLLAGIFLSISWVLGSASGYAIRVFIRSFSDEATLGLFISSFALVNTYLGLVYTSIEGDVYPRLSSTKGDKEDFRTLAQSEMELVLFLIVPLVALLIVFSQPVLQVFYSSKFLGAKNIIMWSAVSMVVRTPGWVASVGMRSLGRNKEYMYNQLVANLYQLIMNIIAFYYWGLLGVGISYTIARVFYSIQSIWWLHRMGYQCINRKVCLLVIATCLPIVTIALIGTLFNNIILYSVGTLIAAFVCLYCYRQLDKRMHITKLIKSKLHLNR